MQYRNLGNSGLKISEIALGGWLNFNNYVDEGLSIRLIQHAFAAGVNLFDVADVYADGQAEVALGKALNGLPRDQIVVATKCRGRMWPGPLGEGLSKGHIMAACEASLKRLQVGHIDLYQVHWPDEETPIEETMEALDLLVRQGKVRYIGCSNFSAKQLEAAQKVATKRSGTRFISSQPRYNLFFRDPEKHLFPACAKLGVGNIVYSPLAHGVLSGKYRTGEPPSQGRLSRSDYESRWGSDEFFAKAAALAALAAEYSMTTAQLALRWCLHQPVVSAVIIGARSHEQLDENLAAASHTLNEDQYQAVSKLAG